MVTVRVDQNDGYLVMPFPTIVSTATSPSCIDLHIFKPIGSLYGIFKFSYILVDLYGVHVGKFIPLYPMGIRL